MCGNHERQLTIIRLLAALVGLPVLSTPARAACVSCVVLHIPAQAVDELDRASGSLNGLLVVVDAADADGAALDRLRAAGARPGVLTRPGEPLLVSPRSAR